MVFLFCSLSPLSVINDRSLSGGGGSDIHYVSLDNQQRAENGLLEVAGDTVLTLGNGNRLFTFSAYCFSGVIFLIHLEFHLT